MKAHVITIGTEITCGEVVNSNAAWISTRLETFGIRVHSHITVRDHTEDVLAALKRAEGELIIVTGGLGPTSDDLTRECMAEFFAQPNEFDEQVWQDLQEMYKKRQLPIREAHRHQCHFPKTSTRLKNPSGTALGFYYQMNQSHYFVLPGPPRELEAMWAEEVAPRLRKLAPPSDLSWHRWTFFAVPESEVAELVEKVIAGSGLEVGYRAQVPYVKVKLFANAQKHDSILKEMSSLLGPSQIPAAVELPEELLRKWPATVIRVADNVSEGALAPRLFHARHIVLQKGGNAPKIQYSTLPGEADFAITMDGDGFVVAVHAGKLKFSERRTLPFKIPLDSDRGRRYATETAFWLAVNALKSL